MAAVRLSRFIFEVSIEKDGERFTAVFQTITTSLIVVPESVWSAIKRDPGQAEQGLVETLLREGFLIDACTNEDAVLASYRQQIVHDFGVIRTKTLLTRRCNNACLYCILDAESKSMSHEASLAVDRFCFELAGRKRPRRIEDLYSGGEVLLNRRILLESASRRYHFYKGCGIEWGFSILTNGTMLEPGVVSRLKEVGLTTIRVSIAGPAAIHDKLRPLKNSRGRQGKSYDLILGNLLAISGEGIPIFVQTQYDSSSLDYLSIPEMMDDFERLGIPVRNVSFTPIMARRDETTYKAGVGDPMKYLFLMKEAEKRGYRQFQDAPVNACMADIRSRITFDTDGSIMACASLQSGEKVYGHAGEGIDFVAESQLLPRKFPAKCLTDCVLLPRCWGGCRLNVIARGEDFNGVDCQAEVLRLVLEEYMRQRALASLSTGNVSAVRQAA